MTSFKLRTVTQLKCAENWKQYAMLSPEGYFELDTAMGPVGYGIGCGMISASNVPVAEATPENRLRFNLPS